MLTTSNNRGFTLFIAIVLMGTLLLIAAGVVSLAVRQSLIAVSGRESQHAFYVADTGIECALYWDVKNPSGTSAFSPSTGSQINCNNQTAIVGGSSQSTFTFNFLPDPYCTTVTVTKGGGGTTAADASGNGNTGTLMGGPTWVGGKYSGALNFDGVNDYVDAGSNSVLDNLTEFTYAAWIYPRSVGGCGSDKPTCGVFVAKAGNGAQGGYKYIGFNDVGQAGGNTNSFRVSAATGVAITTPANSADFNTWQHIAWTVSLGGQVSNIYKNGTLIGTTGSVTLQNDDQSNVVIGSSDALQDMFNGLIDDVRIYNVALTQPQIQDAMNNISSAPSPIAYWKLDDEISSTKIESRGYNTCSSLNPRRVERAVRAIY